MTDPSTLSGQFFSRHWFRRKGQKLNQRWGQYVLFHHVRLTGNDTPGIDILRAC